MRKIFWILLFLYPLSGSADILNFRTVNDHIVRGGRPTATDLTALKTDHGVTVDIDLENVESAMSAEKAVADQAGIQFKSFPMSAWARPKDADVDAILTLLQSATNSSSTTKIFVHCLHGQDRTGLIIGLYRVLIEHVDPQTAYNEMLADGFHTIFFEMDQYFKSRTGLLASF